MKRGLARPVAGYALIFAFALLVRGVVLGQLYDGAPTFVRPEGGDAIFYDRVARGMATAPRAYFHSPLYQWVLTGIYAVTGRELLVVRVLQHLWGALGAVLVSWISFRLWADRRWAWAAGGLAACLGPCVFYEGQLLVDAILPTLLVGCVALMVSYAQRPQGRLAVALGLALGLTALGRATVLVLVPIVGYLVWRVRPALPQRLRDGTGFALALGLCIAPATIHNYVVERDVVLITANGGLNLFVGNNERANGRYVLPPGLWFEPGNPTDDFSGIEAFTEAHGYAPKSSELSRWWADRALAWMQEHPVAVAALWFRKAGLLVADTETPQLNHYYAYAEVAPLLAWLPTAGFVVAPGLVGLWLAWRRANDLATRAVVLVALAYALSFVPFFVVGRYRSPWLLVLAPFAALAVAQAVEAWRSRRGRILVRLGAGLTATAILCFAPFEPFPSPAEQYVLFGRAESRKGNGANARYWYERAVAAWPSLEEPRVELAELLMKTGELEAADRHLEVAITAIPSSARLWALRGRIQRQTEDFEAAEASLRRSLGFAPSQGEVWADLGAVLVARGRFDEAAQALRSALMLVKEGDQARQDLERQLAALETSRAPQAAGIEGTPS